jgi:hypothetical protein
MLDRFRDIHQAILRNELNCGKRTWSAPSRMLIYLFALHRKLFQPPSSSKGIRSQKPGVQAYRQMGCFLVPPAEYSCVPHAVFSKPRPGTTDPAILAPAYGSTSSTIQSFHETMCLRFQLLYTDMTAVRYHNDANPLLEWRRIMEWETHSNYGGILPEFASIYETATGRNRCGLWWPHYLWLLTHIAHHV